MEDTSMAWLEVKDLVKRELGQEIISGLGFAMHQGEKLAIMGETGSGKTSLLKMLGGLMQPDSGNVYFEGKRVPGPLERLIPGADGIAYLSQNADLRPNFFVHEVLEYVNELAAEKAAEIYDLCEITHLLHRKTTQLSGGEKQRVAFARLLTTLPRLLLLDEPFSHLDLPHKIRIKQVIENASRSLGFSTLLVSHEPQDVLPWADRVIIMRNGKVLEEGTPQALYQSPMHFYTAGLTGPFNLLSARLATQMAQRPAEGHKAIAWMVRPDKITCRPPDAEGIAGKIVARSYLGNQYAITLQVADESINAFSAPEALPHTDEIRFWVQPEDVKAIKL